MALLGKKASLRIINLSLFGGLVAAILPQVFPEQKSVSVVLLVVSAIVAVGALLCAKKESEQIVQTVDECVSQSLHVDALKADQAVYVVADDVAAENLWLFDARPHGAHLVFKQKWARHVAKISEEINAVGESEHAKFGPAYLQISEKNDRIYLVPGFKNTPKIPRSLSPFEGLSELPSRAVH